MLYHKKILASLLPLLCRLGIHRWSSNILREPVFRAAYRVSVCASCPARRVRLLPVGGAS